VSFGAGAADSDGPNRNSNYEWSFGDGASGFGPTPQHSYDDPGTYDVTLTVTDEYGASTTATREVSVSNRAPTARINYYPLAPQTGETVTLSGARSSDPDGEITRYKWTVTDAEGNRDSFNTSSERVTATLSNGGTYTVALTVVDNDGSMDEATQAIEVNGPPNVEVTEATDQSPGQDNPGQGPNRYEVSTELFDPNDNLDRVEYELRDRSSGEILDTATDTNVSGRNSTSTEELSSEGGSNREGSYRIVITAYDAQGETASDRVTVAGSG
jgi:PKD repeat protein